MRHVSDLADRIVAVEWEPASFGAHTDSRVALLREYLRRAAWWADHYQAGAGWPFFDIAAVVDPGVRAGEDVLERVAPSLEWAGIDPRPRSSCVAALHFAALLDADGSR